MEFLLAQQIEEAFNTVGTSMMSDDFACKLLAYTYIMGGGNEAVVLHSGLNAGIGIASQKLNIKGGCVPDAKLMPLFKQRCNELATDLEYCDWLPEIFERYNLEPPKKPDKKPKPDVNFMSAEKRKEHQKPVITKPTFPEQKKRPNRR